MDPRDSEKYNKMDFIINILMDFKGVCLGKLSLQKSVFNLNMFIKFIGFKLRTGFLYALTK